MIRILVILIIIGINACLNAHERIYTEDIIVKKDSLYLIKLENLPISYSIEVRAALSKNDEQEGKSKQEWGIVWNYKTSNDFYYVKILCGNSNFGDFLDQRYADIIIGRKQNGVDSIFEVRRFNKGVDTAVGYNTLLLEWNNSTAKFFVGANRLNFVSKINIDLSDGICGVYANEQLHIMSLTIDSKQNIAKKVSTDWSKEKIDKHISVSADKIEGYWEYLDRDNNDKKAKIGGRYKFALIRDGKEYIILYLSGAVTNASSWKLGMIKGRLKPTIFEDHYDLVWYDSMFEPIENDAYADITDDVILKFQFPIYESSFRIYKMREASE